MPTPPGTRPSNIRILIVDDHVVLRMGLVTALSGEPDMEIVGEADNGEQATEAYRLHRPDLVILDLRMPKQDGFETIKAIRAEAPGARVIIFSNYASGDEIVQAFNAGACGFVVKDMPLEQLFDAIRRVHAGEQFIPPEVSARMSRRVVSKLSEREVEVLALVARGLSNKEVAANLNIVEGTVKVHLTHILAKLEVADRTQAIVTALKRGIIDLA